MICSYQSFILAHDVKRCAHAANTVATSIRGFDVIGPDRTFVDGAANGSSASSSLKFSDAAKRCCHGRGKNLQ